MSKKNVIEKEFKNYKKNSQSRKKFWIRLVAIAFVALMVSPFIFQIIARFVR